MENKEQQITDIISKSENDMNTDCNIFKHEYVQDMLIEMFEEIVVQITSNVISNLNIN